MKKTITILMFSLSYFNLKAQIPQPDPDTTARHFLIIASIGNLQEASAGKIATEKAQNNKVRSFGQMMVKDHNDAEQNLLQLARQKKIDLPSQATSGVQPDLNLKNAGSNFDKMYVHAMVNGHRNTVHTFEYYATTGKDADVRNFAKQLLPKLRQHLREILTIDNNLKSSKLLD
jgi:putative membrane protein